ncbi:MAG: WYL domain-containing protein [Planctomycetaceae bacterium]|nr:WYL domain-containing protein [Planctomycetaceae bacterium]
MGQKPTQLERQWRLIRLLSETPDGLPLKTLAERLKTTERTIHRDLVELQEAGIQLQEQTQQHGRKYWQMSVPLKQLSSFRYDEAAALYLGRRFLEPLMQTFLWEAADSALNKIRAQLGSQMARSLDRLLDVFPDMKSHWSRCADKAAMIEELVFGCEERREVKITYRSLAAEDEETYAIRPYELAICGGTIYVTGYSCKSRGIRQWKLERMSSALATNVKFEKPVDFEFSAFASPDAPVQKIRIVFDRKVARFVQEHRWHESERITERPDGSLLVEYELAETVLIKTRLLSYGCHAEVLEPESLRKEMREEIELMRKQYAVQVETK